MKNEKNRKQCCGPICRFLSVTALLVLLTGFASVADAWNIPADRSITWQGNVGVTGGIPSRTSQVDCTQPPYNVPTDGVTNSATAINSCLNGISSGQVAYLPAGTYTITARIAIPSNKTLRGAGPDSTIIQTSASISSLIYMGGGYTDQTRTTVANITSGYSKGSNQIVLDNASGFVAPGYIYVDELNDPNIPVTAVGGSYYGVFPGGTTRTFCVIHKVTAINGNTLTIDPPAVYTFPSSLSPRAIKAQYTYTEYAGVENLTLTNILVGSPDSSGRYPNYNTNVGVYMQGTANCWVKNVKINNLGHYGVFLYMDNYRDEVRDSWMYGALDRYDSDHAYAVHVFTSSFNLVENNIYQSTGEGNMLSSAVGNVLAYNYGYDVGRTADTTWDWMSDWTHGTHNAFNLFEGNYETGIKWDYIHGSGSHNTAFRNRYTSKPDLMSGTNAVGAIITEVGNHYENDIGNVLGTAGWNNVYEVLNPSGNTYGSQKPVYATGVPDSGLSSDSGAFSTTLRHMNFDYYTNSVKLCSDSGEPGCQGGSSDTTLPTSLYLTSKPSWWGNQLWPPFGPDVPGYVGSIPAKDRFQNTPTQKQPSPPPSVQIQ